MANKTVLVVGAGASCEFGLPSGVALKDMIVRSLGASPIKGALHESIERSLGQHSRRDLQDALNEARKISKGLGAAYSIDNFLHLHRENDTLVKVGKLAITSAILRSERDCSINITSANEANFMYSHNHQNNGIVEPNDTWLGTIFKILSTQRSFEEFCEALSNFTFVSFNYDRCIEAYLHVASKNLYPNDEYDAKLLDSSLSIINPYGSLGRIRTLEGCERDFGSDGDAEKIHRAAGGLKTFTEGASSEDKVADALKSCSNLLFLGCGFINLNNRLLERGPDCAPISNVWVTTFREPLPGQEDIKSFVNRNYRRKSAHGQTYQLSNAVVENKKCGELVWDWRRRLESLLGA